MPDESALARFRPVGITWKELAATYPNNTAKIVDIRTDDEIKLGPLPGALRIPLRATDQELADWLQKTGPNHPLVVLCEYGGCLDALKFGTRLRQTGFKQVRFLEEGYRQGPFAPAKAASL